LNNGSKKNTSSVSIDQFFLPKMRVLYTMKYSHTVPLNSSRTGMEKYIELTITLCFILLTYPDLSNGSSPIHASPFQESVIFCRAPVR